MANAAEKLFDQVLSQLPADADDATPDWPELPDGDELGSTDEPPDVDEGEVLPYEHVAITHRDSDRIGSDQSVVEPPSEDKELVEGGIRARGIEALAFYKSRRQIGARPFPGKWGIFYLKQGLTYVACGDFTRLPCL